MANNFLSVYNQQYSKITTKNLYSMLVALGLGGKEAHNTLSKKGAGLTHNFVHYSKGGVQNAPEYTALAIDGNVGVREALTADERSAYTFQLSDDNKMTVGHDFMADRSNDAVQLLKTEIDGEFLYEHAIAANTQFADGDLDVFTNGGGVNPIVLSAVNPHEVLVKSLAQLRILGGAQMNRPYAVFTPAHFARLEQFLGNTGNNLADQSIVNGYRGKIGGIEMYESTNLTHVFTALFTVNPVAGQTFSFNGHVFTFVAALTSTLVGEVLIEVAMDDTIANLVSAITVDETVGIIDVKYYLGPDTIARRNLQKGYAASYDAGTDTLTVSHKRGAIAGLATTTTATLGAIVVQVVMGQMGSLDIAVPRMLHATQERPENGQWTNFINSIRYGIFARSIKQDLMARMLIVA